MELRGVHHVSLNIDDLEASKAFYTDVLGLNLLARPDAEISVPGAWLGLPDGRELHLLVNDLPEAKGQHFAFEVESVDSAVSHLSSKGIKTSEPRVMKGVCRQTFCSDPSGNLIEFNERLA